MPKTFNARSGHASVSSGGVTFVDKNTAVGRRPPTPPRAGGSYLELPPFDSTKFQKAFGERWKIPRRAKALGGWQGVRLDTKAIRFLSYVRGVGEGSSDPIQMGRVTHFEVDENLIGEDVLGMVRPASLNVLGLSFFLALDWDRKDAQQASILARLHVGGIDSLAIVGDVLEDEAGNRAVPGFNCQRGLWSPRFIRLSSPWLDGYTKAIPFMP
mgnify:FL=1